MDLDKPGIKTMDVVSGHWRPTPENLTIIEQMAGVGLTLAQIANALGVDDRNLYALFNAHPEARAAHSRGKARGIENVANSLYHNATQRHDTTAQIFYLKNRAPEEWEEVQKRVNWQAKDNPMNMRSLDDFYADIPQIDDPHTVEGELVERTTDSSPSDPEPESEGVLADKG